MNVSSSLLRGRGWLRMQNQAHFRDHARAPFALQLHVALWGTNSPLLQRV